MPPENPVGPPIAHALESLAFQGMAFFVERVGTAFQGSAGQGCFG
jgi:hypothetical protein